MTVWLIISFIAIVLSFILSGSFSFTDRTFEMQNKFEKIFLNLRDYFRIDFYKRYAKTGDQVYTKIITKKTELEYMKEQSDQKQKKSDDSLLGWLFMLLLFAAPLLVVWIAVGFPKNGFKVFLCMLPSLLPFFDMVFLGGEITQLLVDMVNAMLNLTVSAKAKKEGRTVEDIRKSKAKKEYEDRLEKLYKDSISYFEKGDDHLFLEHLEYIEATHEFVVKQNKKATTYRYASITAIWVIVFLAAAISRFGFPL